MGNRSETRHGGRRIVLPQHRCRPIQPTPPHQLILALTEEPDPLFILQNTFHWIKSISIETTAGQQISAGHFKPINSKRYVNDCHEYVFHLTKTGNVPLDRRSAGVPYQDKSNIARWGHTGGKDLRCRGNTWFIPYETIQSRKGERPHPATFPVALAAQCIKIHGKAEATRMLDPFLGIGSSALAAKSIGIASFTGIEIDPDYLAVAKRRLDPPKRTGFFNLICVPGRRTQFRNTHRLPSNRLANNSLALCFPVT